MTGAEVIAALELANTLAKFAEAQLQKAKERGELTPEEEAKADTIRAEIYARPYWKKKD